MTEVIREFPSCALCGSNHRMIVHADMRDLLYHGPGQFAVVRCLDCGLVYLCPRPTQDYLAAYYSERYEPFSSNAASDAAWSKVYATTLRVALSLFRFRFGPEAITLPPFGHYRMLDVGCGAGAYLLDMQQLGWDVYGVDLSEIAVHAARERIRTPTVWVGTIETLDPSLDEMDLITMNHCLEHVPDPRSTLEAASRRLSRHGKLKIIVPDVSGFESRLFSRYWVGLDVPRHFVDFSKQTLEAFLRQTGFHVESCRPQFWPWSFYSSFKLATELEAHGRWRKAGHRIAKLAYLLAMLSYPLCNRGAIEVVARKVP